MPDAISGSGSLIQAGAGTTVLTGAHSYAGGTTITAGTLQDRRRRNQRQHRRQRRQQRHAGSSTVRMP
jgi:autotransporter-associated beta strand protein